MAKHPLISLAALLLLLVGASAEARFGKRSRKEEQEPPPPAEHALEEAPHDAPVVVVPSHGWSDSFLWLSYWGGPPDPGASVRRASRLEPEAQGQVQGQVQGEAPPPAQGEALAPEPDPITLMLNTDAGAYGGGVGLGLSFLFEGQRLGLAGRMDALMLPTDDGTPGTDRIALLSFKPSLALLRTEALRVRAMAGLDVAVAPDATFVGAGLGLQVDACVLGPLDLEAVAELSLLSHTRVDLQAGPVLRLGTLALRGGWRTILLNDHGHVDGVVHQDVLSGLYVGIGTHF